MKSWHTIFAVLLIFGCLVWLSYRPVWRQKEAAPPLDSGRPELAPSTRENVLTFCADYYMPLTGLANSEHEGYGIDLLRDIYEPLGYRVNYRNAPWRRCIRDVRDGVASAIVGASGEEAPDFIFPDTEIGTVEIAFFTLADENWSYSGLASLEEMRLGIVRDYVYSDSLDRYISDNNNSQRILAVSDEEPVVKLVELLLAEKIDVFAEDVRTVQYFLKSHPDYARQIKSTIGPKDAVLPIYVAFSPLLPTSQYLSELFDLRMAEFEKFGLLKNTFEKYGYDAADLFAPADSGVVR